MKRILILALALVLLLGLVAVPVMAAKPGGQQEMLYDAVVLAADRHLSLQGEYYDTETESDVDNTWEWIIGSNSTGLNVQGISATGLLAAWEKTGDLDYLDGAILAGDTLVDRYNAASENRTFSQDIEFLVRLSQDSAETSYATVAQQWYANTMSAYDAEELVEYYVVTRGYLAAWDLASQIRAAVAVGETDYAAGIASSFIDSNFDWEHPWIGGWDYGSLLWALAELHDESFNSYAGELRGTLLSSQQSDGSWDWDYQSTAYAILGLIADGTAKGAQAKAWVFFRDTQTEDGGWDYPPEYGEINSEVIMALSALDLKGLKAGHTDPNPDRGQDTGRHKLDPLAP